MIGNFAELTREQAVADLRSRMAKIKEQVGDLPLAEQLRLAADLVDNNMRTEAKAVVDLVVRKLTV